MDELELGQPITLNIHARKHEYTFSYAIKDKVVQVESTIPTKAFTPLFTGVHLGLYAQGANDVPCSQNAYFKYAEWTAA